MIRESRIRLEQRPDGLWVVVVGAPFTKEYRLDTTGSMGDNVERAIKVLPQICELTATALPGRDHFYCASIFGDVVDQFVLCRGQFEVLAERMVDQLTLMHPEGSGGDEAEDPHYGLFGAAYLTNAYLHRIGLRSYDYTITDAPCHERLNVKTLKRVFGDEVFEKVKENGHQISQKDLPTNRELVDDLKLRAFPFCLLVKGRTNEGTKRQWQSVFGAEYVVDLPEIEYVSHVMSVISGLVEGTLDLRSAKDFLISANLSKVKACQVVDAVSHIPIGAQCALPNFNRLPKKGDVFAEKADLWPVDPTEVSSLPSEVTSAEQAGGSGGWL